MPKKCHYCASPLVRKPRESHSYFDARKYCNRSCRTSDRNANPIWLTFAQKAARNDSGCIEWTGHKDAKGYGRFASHSGEILAHRLAYGMHYGAVPVGKFVLHRCDNPACVNPSHLFLGNNQDNMDDMKRKGRASRRFGRDNPNYRHGRNCAPEQHKRGGGK